MIRIVKDGAKDIFVIYPDKDTPSAFKAYRKSDTIPVDIDEMAQKIESNLCGRRFPSKEVIEATISEYLQEKVKK